MNDPVRHRALEYRAWNMNDKKTGQEVMDDTASEANVKKLALNDCTNCRPAVIQKLKSICAKLKNAPTDDILKTGKFIDHVFQSNEKSIIAVPCGGGKSQWSLAAILATAPKQRTMLIVDTLQTGKLRQLQLVDYGLEGMVGFSHSFWEDECRELRQNHKLSGFDYDEWQENKNVCKKCPARKDCSVYLRKSEGEKPVVIMAHEGFIRMLERNEIPADYDIIVDEEPTQYHFQEFDWRDLNELLPLLPESNDTAIESVRALLKQLVGIASEMQPTGTIRWTNILSKQTIEKAIAKVAKHAEDWSEAHAMKAAEQSVLAGKNANADPIEPIPISYDDNLPVQLEDKQCETLYLLAYALSQQAEVYVAADKLKLDKGKVIGKVYIARDRIDFHITNRIVLLNGSAFISRFQYPPEMKTWYCPDLERNYSNVTLHCHCAALPTKTNFREKEIVDAFCAYAIENTPKSAKVFIARNKDGDASTLVSKYIAKHFSHLSFKAIGERGTIQGRNDWRNYHHGIVAMSLFTKVHAYALYASLKNGKEYACTDLFNKQGSLYVTRNLHLKHPDIDEQFTAFAAHECYQTIMRLSCRHQYTTKVSAVAMIPTPHMLRQITRLMPHVRVKSNKDRLNYCDTLLNTNQTITNHDLVHGLGLNHEWIADLDEAAKIAEMFGWEQQKVVSHGSTSHWQKQAGDHG